MWTAILAAISGLWSKITGSSAINLRILFILFNSGTITIEQIEEKLPQEKSEQIKADLQLLCLKNLAIATGEEEFTCYKITEEGQKVIRASLAKVRLL